MWGSLGLEKWAYADKLALLLHATSRQFFSVIEEPHADLIKNPKAEYGAMLVAKYKGIRLHKSCATSCGTSCATSSSTSCVTPFTYPPFTCCLRATWGAACVCSSLPGV